MRVRLTLPPEHNGSFRAVGSLLSLYVCDETVGKAKSTLSLDDGDVTVVSFKDALDGDALLSVLDVLVPTGFLTNLDG